MSWIFRIKSWQVFLLIFPCIIFQWIEFEKEMRWINLIGFTIFALWMFLLTDELIKIVPKEYEMKTNVYYFNAIFVFISTSSAIILLDDEGYEGEGIIVLVAFYFVYAFFQSFGFAARLIKSLELGRKAKKRESLGYAFLFAIFPIGIWYIHPKLNKMENL